MNAKIQHATALSHQEIARLACQIWLTEGAQNGRDQEYWLRAEQQLRTVSQQGDIPKNYALMKLNPSAALLKNTASQPTKLAGSSAGTTHKRVPVRF